MSFIENASHFSLGDGVYYNVQGNINFFNSKRRCKEIEGRSSTFYDSTIGSIETIRWIRFGAVNTTSGETSSIE
jgi:hypothetical protein